jgi:pimeloyl-ACP methyl ester carboxylesterase
MTFATDAWERRGTMMDLGGYQVFVVDLAAGSESGREPLLVLHGFPTSSFDFHLVADGLAADRRVVLFDLVGYGFSDKPDIAHTVDLQADVAVALTEALDLDRLALLTHDYGDTVGGELLARQTEGRWPVEIARRVLTNGSIYLAMAQLSAGQQLLASLPDRRLPDGSPPDPDQLARGLVATFSPDAAVDPEEVAGQVELVVRNGGQTLLPRTIRYLEERRRREGRFTGAIERHPSPLGVVWGADDPIALVAMTDRLRQERPDATVTLLHGVGHFPMVEAPGRFLGAVTAALESRG